MKVYILRRNPRLFQTLDSLFPIQLCQKLMKSLPLFTNIFNLTTYIIHPRVSNLHERWIEMNRDKYVQEFLFFPPCHELVDGNILPPRPTFPRGCSTLPFGMPLVSKGETREGGSSRFPLLSYADRIGFGPADVLIPRDGGKGIPSLLPPPTTWIFHPRCPWWLKAWRA